MNDYEENLNPCNEIAEQNLDIFANFEDYMRVQHQNKKEELENEQILNDKK